MQMEEGVLKQDGETGMERLIIYSFSLVLYFLSQNWMLIFME